LPAEKLVELPGHSSDVAKNRAWARAMMEKFGYGPNKRLAVTVSTRNTPGYRDPAVIAIDQMKEIYIDGTFKPKYRQLVSEADPQGLYDRRQQQRDRGRRPRPDAL
jgi:hypothetical protein